MKYNVISTKSFRKQVKSLIKKYASLKDELFELTHKLVENPKIGTPIGNNCFKIRIKISSKNKGKSGGARIITYFIASNYSVYMVAIYDKSVKESLSENELKELIASMDLP